MTATWLINWKWVTCTAHAKANTNVQRLRYAESYCAWNGIESRDRRLNARSGGPAVGSKTTDATHIYLSFFRLSLPVRDQCNKFAKLLVTRNNRTSERASERIQLRVLLRWIIHCVIIRLAHSSPSVGWMTVAARQLTLVAFISNHHQHTRRQSHHHHFSDTFKIKIIIQADALIMLILSPFFFFERNQCLCLRLLLNGMKWNLCWREIWNKTNKTAADGGGACYKGTWTRENEWRQVVIRRRMEE